MCSVRPIARLWGSSLPVALLVPCLVLSLSGCGQMIRKVPRQPAVVPPAIPADAPQAPVPIAPAAPSCALRLAPEPVAVPRNSPEGITVEDHLEVSGCTANGPYTVGVTGGHGCLKKVAGGGIRYLPPTRDADPSCRTLADSLEVSVECPHGGRADGLLQIRIMRPGEVPPAPAGPASAPPATPAPPEPMAQGPFGAHPA